MKNNMRKWMNITEGRIDELFTGDVDLDIKSEFHKEGADFLFDANGTKVGTYIFEKFDRQSVIVDDKKIYSSPVYECTFKLVDDDDSSTRFKPTGNNKGQFLILEGVVKSIKLFLEKTPDVILYFSGEKETGQSKLYAMILRKIKSDLAAMGYRSLEYKNIKLKSIDEFGVIPANWTIPSKEELKKFRDEMEKEEEEAPPSDIEQLSPDEFDELMAFLKKEGTI